MSDVRADIARILRIEGGLSDLDSVRVADIVARHMLPYVNARKAMTMEGYAVHHINGKSWDNRLENLKLVKVER